jgi:hypothetical protein
MLMLGGPLGDSQATIDISGADGPEVLAGAGGVGLSAAFLTYSYEVVGPVTGALVPTTITGYLDVEGDTSGVSAGFAIAEIHGSIDSGYAEACIGSFEECAYETSPSSTPYSQTFMVPANTPETLTLEAAVEAEGSDGGGYSAYVDPIIAIDRSAPGTAQYGLIESPGVNDGPVALGPATGVPEPATWVLLISGFAALGWTVRSRRGLTPEAPAGSE